MGTHLLPRRCPRAGVTTVGSAFGLALGMGTSLLIKATGRVVIYAGSKVVDSLRSNAAEAGTPSKPVSQTGFTCTHLNKGLAITQTETEDGMILISLYPVDRGVADAGSSEGGEDDVDMASYEVVSPMGMDGPIPFQDEDEQVLDDAAEQQHVGLSLPDDAVAHAEELDTRVITSSDSCGAFPSDASPRVTTDSPTATAAVAPIPTVSAGGSGGPLSSVVDGILLEHRYLYPSTLSASAPGEAVGVVEGVALPDGVATPWQPAVWDAGNHCFVVPVAEDGVASLELRARAVE